MKKSLFVAALFMLAGMTLNAQESESNYAKSDFVPGDEIIFDDNFEGEKLGEFPLRWDLLDGYAETAQQKGRNVLAFTDNGLGQVMPLMKEKWDWLPEVFTVEFDLYVAPVNTGDEEGTLLEMNLYFGDRGDESYYNASSYVRFWYREDGSCSLTWSLLKPDGSSQSSGEKMLGLTPGTSDYLEKDNPVVAGAWNHFAFSFNKRAFKGYVNGMRIINVPAMKAPGYLFFASGAYYRYTGLSNVRIAQGAVPLYDRLTADGKIVTYAITFESGKADLKPESIVEINRVAKLMQEHTDLSFEVQGHCDNTGSDAVNDPLSQRRAEAIVDALVKLGIDKSRLSAVGKGSHSPIAPNTSEEGRAKNRRVEFVKK
ncbi:MAG: OmpA family protein [Bacteroidales bacterium]|nr:OmpA family protein [Bacteroidales bacterium]